MQLAVTDTAESERMCIRGLYILHMYICIACIMYILPLRLIRCVCIYI